jgi:hypothetical protein
VVGDDGGNSSACDPVFPGTPGALSVNGTPFLSVWWVPPPPSASHVTLTFRYTGGAPGWFGFGPSPLRSMVGTDAWLVRVLQGPAAAVAGGPVANVTDMRLSVKGSALGTVDASQDVALLSATWVNASSDPGAAALCARSPCPPPPCLRSAGRWATCWRACPARQP